MKTYTANELIQLLKPGSRQYNLLMPWIQKQRDLGLYSNLSVPNFIPMIDSLKD